MSRSDFKWSFKSLFKLSLNCVLLMPIVESFFKVFLFLILVHASTEISKYIWAILVFFLMRKVLNNHVKDSNVSSYRSVAPKMTISLKWFKPTNTPKGMYSLFVPNVVSNVTTSPK
ncbi:uncharacterized protein LOC119338269 [Triticum dicoccoides]|uniref:uncharacterized protein LOC119338269 n=1 Tax=Triticum dicoccoides TaxID=85692 RepID=UPI0018915EBF|nr:uncharacterized protein LOC119338269 [Triticum dicoccoides]